MTDVNTLNERTRQEAINRETGDRLAALLIAVYRLPLEQRKVVLAQYERNLKTIKRERLAKNIGAEMCETCQGDGYVDIDGDAGELGWDKIGEKPCPECFPDIKSEPEDNYKSTGRWGI